MKIQEMWNSGCQVVALNYQTHCHEMMLNQGRFRDNGACGYVLKPELLREPARNFNPMDLATFEPQSTRCLTVTVIRLEDKKKDER
mgnify:CR=1 FL=1